MTSFFTLYAYSNMHLSKLGMCFTGSLLVLFEIYNNMILYFILLIRVRNKRSQLLQQTFS